MIAPDRVGEVCELLQRLLKRYPGRNCKALFIWIAIGLALIFGFVYSLKEVYEQKEDNKRWKADSLQLLEEKEGLVAENLALRCGEYHQRKSMKSARYRLLSV